MSGAMSLYLDAVRALAALVVFCDHLLINRFHDRRTDLNGAWNFGPDAVIVFFVLSGFVIAHAAVTKDRTAGAFAFSRLTRLHSVAVPAFLLTWAADRIGIALAPAAYAGGWYQQATLGEHLYYGLTLSNEWALGSVWIGSNGALWSLSYEAAYYALFLVLAYTRGLRRAVLTALVAVLAGPEVLLLLPAWLLGVGTYHILRGARGGGSPVWLLLAALPLAAYALIGLAGHPRIPDGAWAAAGAALVGELGRSTYFLWDNLLALLVAAHLLLAGLALKGAEALQGARARVIRFAAAHSFSLYVCHLPLMQLAFALLAPAVEGSARIALIAIFALIGSVLFARLFEAPLPRYRARIRRMLARRDITEVTSQVV